MSAPPKLELIITENGSEYDAKHPMMKDYKLDFDTETLDQFFEALHEYKDWNFEEYGKALVNIEQAFGHQNIHYINAIFADWMLYNPDYFLWFHDKNQIKKLMEEHSDDFEEPAEVPPIIDNEVLAVGSIITPFVLLSGLGIGFLIYEISKKK
jgi:hypothetical protein